MVGDGFQYIVVKKMKTKERPAHISFYVDCPEPFDYFRCVITDISGDDVRCPYFDGDFCNHPDIKSYHSLQ